MLRTASGVVASSDASSAFVVQYSFRWIVVQSLAQVVRIGSDFASSLGVGQNGLCHKCLWHMALVVRSTLSKPSVNRLGESAVEGTSGLAMDRCAPASFAVGRLDVKHLSSFLELNSSMQIESPAALVAPP